MVFFSLFLLSVFRPVNFSINAVYEGACIFGAFFFLMFILQRSGQFKSFLINNLYPIAIVHLYFFLLTLSLIYNSYFYSSLNEFLFSGALYVVIEYFFFICVILFSLLDYSRRNLHYISYFIFIFISLTSIWQFVEHESASSFLKYFISSDLDSDTNVTSVFAISTDLGSVLGFSLIYLCTRLSSPHVFKNEKILNVLVIILVTAAGLICGARIFILISIVAALSTTIIMVFVSRSTHTILLFPLLIIISSLFIHFLPQDTAISLGRILPFVKTLHLGENFNFSDFRFVFESSSVEERVVLWKHAFSIIEQHNSIVLGVSNGVLRLLSENPVNNTHSWIVQALVDGGVFALCTIVVLLIIVYKKLVCNKKYGSIIFINSLLASLLFDFPIDHSLPWIIIVAFLLNATHSNTLLINSINKKEKVFYDNHLAIVLFFIISVLSLIGTWSLYDKKLENNGNLTLQERIELRNLYNRATTVIFSNQAAARIETEFKEFTFSNRVEDMGSLCFFTYLDSAIFYSLEGERTTLDSRNLNYKKLELQSTSVDSIVCDKHVATSFHEVAEYKWISDNRHYDAYLDKHESLPLWGAHSLFSAAFMVEGSNECTVSLDAKLLKDNGVPVELSISINDVVTRQPLTFNSVLVSAPDIKSYAFNTSCNWSNPVYFAVSPNFPDEDRLGDRNYIIIFPNSLSVVDEAVDKYVDDR